MKMQTKVKVAGWLFVILYFGLNTYYGWNRTPESRIEAVTDIITAFFGLAWLRYRITIDAASEIKEIPND